MFHVKRVAEDLIGAMGRSQFMDRLGVGLGYEPDRGLGARLWGHYEELIRWQERVPLVGGGTGRRGGGEAFRGVPEGSGLV